MKNKKKHKFYLKLMDLYHMNFNNYNKLFDNYYIFMFFSF